MTKRALITGGTDGIGRAIALELAARDYQVHVLGRSDARGREVLQLLREVNPGAQHQLFLVDLASIEACRSFLDEYQAETDHLDLLILNANAFSTKLEVTADGIEKNFAVGCVARYQFAATLDPILRAGTEPRVMYVGGSTFARRIRYDALTNPSYGIVQALGQAFGGSALLALFFGAKTGSPVAHEYMEPGVVNTRVVQERMFLVRWLSRLAGLIEPRESGSRIADHIVSTTGSDVAAKFFKLGKPRPVSRRLRRDDFERLVQYCEKATGVPLPNR